MFKLWSNEISDSDIGHKNADPATDADPCSEQEMETNMPAQDKENPIDLVDLTAEPTLKTTGTVDLQHFFEDKHERTSEKGVTKHYRKCKLCA